MMVYRLAARQYIDDLTGTGAKLFGGRWNPVGKACIYTSSHISLALLEKFVHANHQENMQRIALLRIELPDESDLIFHTDEKLLKESWPDDITYSQWIGEQVLSDSSVITFSVPSAIVPSERNYILNPLAKDFNRVKIISVTDFTTDFRLLSKLLP
ncbi:RES family NAD+ phosphorylase [Dyadobacter aurulentus]|uniref:RES family NAD+ phosphorylase n=1 Tax=Dyadobacter sp. UC 10 TaxID=2605428 RepID=UPI0011F2E3EC|nr:RES family NAD+ phosphorylase [Dyadobacter sp. UC 10]KAA0991544.1 RES family NAD+ phosphorylase [Dyadobacter sp. UC 10]